LTGKREVWSGSASGSISGSKSGSVGIKLTTQ
jgi:hypothetical protein